MNTEAQVEAKDFTFYTQSLDCVHCGLCLPACPTYDVFGLETDSPRGRIYLMRALAEGRLESPNNVRIHLDRCLDCRACETACPSGVEYGRILETARSEIESASPAPGIGAKVRRFLLAHVVAKQGRLRAAFKVLRLAHVLRLDRLAAQLHLIPSGARRLLPRIPPGSERRSLAGSYMPEGTPRGRVALFTGCVMEQMFGSINRQTVQLLLANGFAVDVPEAQVCCGALHVHNGQAGIARGLAERNIAAFAGADFIVNNSAGCGAALKEYGHLLGTEGAREFGSRCRDITEFLGSVGLVAEPAPCPETVTYDDPCHLCHGQGVRSEPRALLAAIPEIDLVTHPDPERCCGSAGIYNLVHAGVAAEIGHTKAASLAASGAGVVATGNPGCMMQISAHLRDRESPMRVTHPVELLLPETPPNLEASASRS